MYCKTPCKPGTHRLNKRLGQNPTGTRNNTQTLVKRVKSTNQNGGKWRESARNYKKMVDKVKINGQ